MLEVKAHYPWRPDYSQEDGSYEEGAVDFWEVRLKPESTLRPVSAADEKALSRAHRVCATVSATRWRWSLIRHERSELVASKSYPTLSLEAHDVPQIPHPLHWDVWTNG